VRVVGVIDLRGGQAVHARAGQRDRYATLGDAVELARTYVDRHGLRELYVADLDAIVGGPTQGAAITAVAAAGASVWLDAAVSSVDRARHVLGLGATHVVVGLETLPSWNALQEICEGVGGQHTAFSLDLRDGTPLGIAREEPVNDVSTRAADAGVNAIIVLDFARVGMRTGLDLQLIARVRDAAPNVTLLVGGGVRGADDLARLADAGCDGALVATALQDGSLDGYVTSTR
jgi:phosphoribosylformimino-5-aminoimidazole carboxamide ribotide isomerase